MYSSILIHRCFRSHIHRLMTSPRRGTTSATFLLFALVEVLVLGVVSHFRSCPHLITRGPPTQLRARNNHCKHNQVCELTVGSSELQGRRLSYHSEARAKGSTTARRPFHRIQCVITDEELTSRPQKK